MVDGRSGLRGHRARSRVVTDHSLTLASAPIRHLLMVECLAMAHHPRRNHAMHSRVRSMVVGRSGRSGRCVLCLVLEDSVTATGLAPILHLNLVEAIASVL